MKDEVSAFEPAYDVRDACAGAQDSDLIVVYLISNPTTEVAFLAKYLKEGVNP